MKEDQEQLFKSLFAQYYPQLTVYVRSLVGESDAEDIVEDVFEELWNYRHRIEMGEKIGSFLYRSALSHSLNHLRHQKVSRRHLDLIRQVNMQAIAIDEQVEAMEQIENDELQRRVMEAIAGLPEKCREAFKLRYVYGMKTKEVSDALDISPRTVEAHLYKALKLLRKQFLLVLLMLTLLSCKCLFAVSYRGGYVSQQGANPVCPKPSHTSLHGLRR